MIKTTNTDNTKIKAFTLIEMIIVLIIMWILLMMGIWLSGSQVQKIQNKTVKESILSEWQSRYSRNLWSSSFAWEHYDTMNVKIVSWNNEIKFSYDDDNDSSLDWDVIWNQNREYTFTDRFEIISISWHETPVTIQYEPYRISCSWSGNENWTNLTEQDKNKTLNFKARVNNSQDYCFEINSKNCRLMEVECDEEND